MASRNELLAEMVSLVRPKKTLHHLSIDDCLPYLVQTYNSMAVCSYESWEVAIDDILQRLQSKTDQYVCYDKEALSRQIWMVLDDRGIPVGLLYTSDEKQQTIKGVTLYLYRQ